MADAERWLADYTRKVGEIQRRAEQTQEQIKNLRARAASQDGTVSVVLAPGGRLESLTLTPRAMELGHQRLAATITQTIQAAHADAAAQTQDALRPLVGESDAMEFLRDQVDSALADDPAATAGDSGRQEDGGAGQVPRSATEQPPGRPVPPTRAPRRPGGDGDEPFGGSIMRRD